MQKLEFFLQQHPKLLRNYIEHRNQSLMMKLGILIQELVVRLLYWLNIMPLYTRKNKDSTKKTLRKVPKSHPEQLYIDI